MSAQTGRPHTSAHTVAPLPPGRRAASRRPPRWCAASCQSTSWAASQWTRTRCAAPARRSSDTACFRLARSVRLTPNRPPTAMELPDFLPNGRHPPPPTTRYLKFLFVCHYLGICSGRFFLLSGVARSPALLVWRCIILFLPEMEATASGDGVLFDFAILVEYFCSVVF